MSFKHMIWILHMRILMQSYSFIKVKTFNLSVCLTLSIFLSLSVPLDFCLTHSLFLFLCLHFSISVPLAVCLSVSLSLSLCLHFSLSVPLAVCLFPHSLSLFPSLFLHLSPPLSLSPITNVYDMCNSLFFTSVTLKQIQVIVFMIWRIGCSCYF